MIGVGHKWEKDYANHDNNEIAVCACGARLAVGGMSSTTNPAALQTCPLYVSLTEEELGQIAKKRHPTIEERARVRDSAVMCRQARKDALEPFAKLGETYCDESTSDLSDSTPYAYDSPGITIGMLRAAYRAWSRRV